MSKENNLIAAVLQGDGAAAARALSLVVDEAPASPALIKAFFSSSGKAHKIGLCGSPGSGKSSLIGRMITMYRRRGLKVAVLAVDPTSPISGGAFLGDRLRVQEHVLDEGVFIRSLASRGMIGGVSHTIFGAVHVLEAAGFDKIIIETVGTGQDEVVIAKVADTVLYLTTPQMGDEIQAMKAGIMEIGDCFVVHKSDLAGADKAVGELRAALGLDHAIERKPPYWDPPVVAVSSLNATGLEALEELVDKHKDYLKDSGMGLKRIREQHREELSLYVSRRIYRDALRRLTEKQLDDLMAHRTDPTTLGNALMRRP